MLNIYATELLVAQRREAAERYWTQRAASDVRTRRVCADTRRRWWRPVSRPCFDAPIAVEPRRPVTVLP